jgi:transposase-like protein
MADAIHTEARFNDEDAARQHLESVYWPHGPVCPHCGGTERNTRLQGTAHRAGLLYCADCKSQFTVTVGTVFERSKVPLHKWVFATHLMCASKKGISSKQLERMLGVTYKTAWFMSHRIREAMNIEPKGQLGGNGAPVEVDETFWGNKGKHKPGARSYHHQMKIVSLVERDGEKRPYHVPNVSPKTRRPILQAQIAARAHLMTDQFGAYQKLGHLFAQHSWVNHSFKEYSRGTVTTNSAESSFALLKRGLVGTFHSVGAQHLQRYVNEFDFRWNTRIARGYNDTERAAVALKNIGGKRLTYRRTDAQSVN